MAKLISVKTIIKWWAKKNKKIDLELQWKKKRNQDERWERMKNKRALARSNATYAFSDPDIGAVFWNRKWIICLIGWARKKKQKRAPCGFIQVDVFSNTRAFIWDLISQMSLRSALPRLQVTDWRTDWLLHCLESIKVIAGKVIWTFFSLNLLERRGKKCSLLLSKKFKYPFSQRPREVPKFKGWRSWRSSNYLQNLLITFFLRLLSANFTFGKPKNCKCKCYDCPPVVWNTHTHTHAFHRCLWSQLGRKPVRFHCRLQEVCSLPTDRLEVEVWTLVGNWFSFVRKNKI